MEGRNLSNRIKWIDIAKGIGIVLILFSHSVWPESVKWADGLLIPIFFFLSGYNYSSPKVLSKAKSLLVPYILYNILIIVFAVLTKSKPFDNSAIEGILYSRYSLYPTGSTSNTTLLGYGNAPLWFLTAMFVSYLLFLPLGLCSEKRASLLCGLYILLTVALRFCPILLPWSLDCAPFFATIMYSGLIVKKYGIKHKWVPILCAAIYIVASFTNGDINLSIREYGRSVLICLFTSLSGCIVISEFAKRISSFSLSTPLAIVGRYSLSIFCLQLPVLHVVKSISSGLLPDHSIVVAILQVLAGCTSGIVFSVTIDHIKPLIHVK